MQLNAAYNIGSVYVFTASFETGGVHISNSVLHTLYVVPPEKRKKNHARSHALYESLST